MKKIKIFLIPFWFYLVFYLIFVTMLFFHELIMPQSYKDIFPFSSSWHHSGDGVVIKREAISVRIPGGKRKQVTRYHYSFKWLPQGTSTEYLGECYSKEDNYQVESPVSISIYNNNKSISKIKDTLSTPITPESIYVWVIKIMIMALGFPLLIYVARLDKHRGKKKKRIKSTQKPSITI